MLTLYQFPFSHFCEKACWALDLKQQPYRVVNLLPALHLLWSRRMASASSLPILRDGAYIVQDSSAIIDFLDLRWPQLGLTPTEPALAGQAREWERWLGEEIGVPLRLWFYSHVLRQRQYAMAFLLRGASRGQGLVFQALFGLIRHAMFYKMQINPHSAAAALPQLERALDTLEAALHGRDYLVGNAFSRADLTAAALLWPMLPWNGDEAAMRDCLPDAVGQWRQGLVQRPLYGWLQRTYHLHRPASCIQP
ncbi:glutathione S-transferase family protein [Aquitalea sp. LB_tupeE]|uniref:glutathione S-transferase family protein n=1 Tax=Aquitalea sp. LB_tupeE TaxID=2748078 RepID=UPI0015BE8B9D|nr:glutathione S-transferase family protein [Aquitalea sp. LB_tupeE]NWK77439.1 glutathione S-transferase family protein [Aquitalea sp. LB_tupeE]